MTIRAVAKLTVEMPDHALYRALKHAAVDRGVPLREIVTQALREWLERQEQEADLAAFAEADAEGGPPLPWEQFKAQLDALGDAAEGGE
ncbi:MAG: hypothetical protein HYY05_02875 [Chloroflexi bacterium]|nr:hypothetical protein [Chloroflexota bacterium]